MNIKIWVKSCNFQFYLVNEMAFKRNLGKQQELFYLRIKHDEFCFAVGEQGSSETYFNFTNSI